MNPTARLADLRERGVEITIDGADLVLNGPASVLTSELCQELAAEKPELVRRLREAAAVNCPPAAMLDILAVPRGERLTASLRGQRLRKPPTMRARADDNFQTPGWALRPLYRYLKPGWTIWEPAAGRGNLVRAMETEGYRVIASDITVGRDFLEWEPAERWDAIVTNGPFSLKDAFLRRAYQLGKPFAMLLPINALGGKRRQELYRCDGLEIMMLGGRIDFETPSGEGSGAWQEHCWIGRRLGFRTDPKHAIIFVDLFGDAGGVPRRGDNHAPG